MLAHGRWWFKILMMQNGVCIQCNTAIFWMDHQRFWFFLPRSKNHMYINFHHPESNEKHNVYVRYTPSVYVGYVGVCVCARTEKAFVSYFTVVIPHSLCIYFFLIYVIHFYPNCTKCKVLKIYSQLFSSLSSFA